MQHPDDLAAYLNFAIALSNLKFAVTYNGQTLVFPVRFSGQNATIDIILPP